MKSVVYFLWSIKDIITVFPKQSLCLNARKCSLSSLDTCSSSSEFWLLGFSTCEINSSVWSGATASTYFCAKRVVASWNFFERLVYLYHYFFSSLVKIWQGLHQEYLPYHLCSCCFFDFLFIQGNYHFLNLHFHLKYFTKHLLQTCEILVFYGWWKCCFQWGKQCIS